MTNKEKRDLIDKSIPLLKDVVYSCKALFYASLVEEFSFGAIDKALGHASYIGDKMKIFINTNFPEYSEMFRFGEEESTIPKYFNIDGELVKVDFKGRVKALNHLKTLCPD